MTQASGSIVSEAVEIVGREVISVLNKLELRIYTCNNRDFTEYLISNLERCQTPDCILQIIPKNFVVSMKHIKLAAYLAFKAFDKKRNISKKKHIELLLYLLGERQINKVIEKLRTLGRSPYLVVLACMGDGAEEIVRRVNLQKHCSELKQPNDIDPIEAGAEIDTLKILFNLREGDEPIKSVLCKISSLILQA